MKSPSPDQIIDHVREYIEPVARETIVVDDGSVIVGTANLYTLHFGQATIEPECLVSIIGPLIILD